MAPQAPRPGLTHTPPHVTARFVASGALARVFPPDLVAALRDEAGLDPAPLSADELRAGAAADCEALFATWGMPALSEAELAAALPRLRAVFYAAGSVQAFARPLLARGVAVFSAWAQNAVPVAEMAVSQILLANKGFFRFRFGPKDPAAGETERHAAAAYPGNLGCRVGLLGAGGRIGSLVARALREHRVEVLGYDPFLPDARAAELGVRKAGLEEIFGTCQTVSNHLADNPATRNGPARSGTACASVPRTAYSPSAHSTGTGFSTASCASAACDPIAPPRHSTASSQYARSAFEQACPRASRAPNVARSTPVGSRPLVAPGRRFSSSFS